MPESSYSNIRNIILDLGGVIIDLDYSRTAGAFIHLGMSGFDEVYSKARQTAFFDDFEKGFLDEDAFRADLRKHLPDHVTDRDIDRAWNAMLLGVPMYRIDWLRQLGKHYRLFLLSNTNTIHIRAFTEMLDREFNGFRIEELFEKSYFSCLLGMRKPDRNIFLHVLNENGLDPADTLFVDDSIQHIEGATAAGIRAEWLNLEAGELTEMKYRLLFDAEN